MHCRMRQQIFLLSAFLFFCAWVHAQQYKAIHQQAIVKFYPRV